MDLIQLLEKKSKHSDYQLLSQNLKKILGDNSKNVSKHFEAERLDFISETVDVKNRKLIDIGANTGFFTFELLDRGASTAICFEGNKDHADFIIKASKVLNQEDRIIVKDEYVEFESGLENFNTDIVLLLNVLHHVGDDYGEEELSKDQALCQIVDSLKKIAKISTYVIFQLGFNWKGDRYQPLFDNGTKSEMIAFLRKNIESFFDITRIGIAQKIDNGVMYSDLTDVNIERDDSLGEFLNRPLFIMKSKVKK
jgi:hypothetical protein